MTGSVHVVWWNERLDAAFEQGPVVLHARVFQELGARIERPRILHRPRAGVGLWIGEREGVFDRAEVHPPERLRDAWPRANRVTDGVDSGVAVQVDRLDDQRIPVPSPNRLPEPRRWQVFRERAAV